MPKIIPEQDEEYKPITYRCSICSQLEQIEDYNPSSKYLALMLERKICLNCAFIVDILENSQDRKVIINGVCYIALPYVKRPENKIAGTCGKEFYIFVPSTQEYFKTNNLQEKGRIPNSIRDKYPDNAVFISLPSYTKLSGTPFKCHSVGCWDRYRCARYNLSLEKDNGPFNQIPKNYVIGSQNCPSFIDFYELKK